MEQLLAIIQQNDELIHQWGYLALFAAAWIEGFHAMVIGGFLASVGKLNPLGVLAVMTAGHILSGFSWYMVGYFGGFKPLERWGRHFKLTKERLERAMQYFEKHGGKAIVVTKLTVGLTIATIIIAGVLKMPFKKFSAYNAAGSLVWAAITMGFGYSFGLSFRLIAQYIESFTRLAILFFIFLAGAIVFWYVLRRIFRRGLAQETLR